MFCIKPVYCLLIGCCLATPLHAQEYDLTGDWQFSTDTKHVANQAWTRNEFDHAAWDTMPVPGNWDTHNDYAHFSGTGFYTRQFTLPLDWQQSHVRLCFDAVYQTANVWINGHHLGEHVGGYTPFDFDVTAYLHTDQPNLIAVSASNQYGRGAWWKWGGISRRVYLQKEAQLRIVRQQITAEPDLTAGTSQINMQVFVENNTDQPITATLHSQVYDQNQSTAIAKPVTQSVSVQAKQIKTVAVQVKLTASQTRLWDLDRPYLYRMVSDVYLKEQKVATHSDRFGIRKIQAKDAKLYLNGKQLHLNGFNRVATHRAYGQTEPENLVKFDIDAMLAMGARMTRIAHQAQHPALLDYCDEVGMLIIEEIPVWGKTDPQVKPDNVLTKQWLSETIQRDFNHPCIIGWSVGNELAEKNLSGQRMSWKVYEYVRSMLEHVAGLDPSRLKTYVSNTATEANGPGVDPNDLVDILCHNSYGGSSDQVQKLHRIWPDKPVFVTELGKSQLGEHLDDAKLDPRLIAQIKALKAFDFVVGCSIWSFNDYRSKFSKTPPGENRAWGMYTVWRQPKAGAYQIREIFTGKGSDQSLPSMTHIPEIRPKGNVYIEAILPMPRSCMVGFTVVDKQDEYEIGYQLTGGSEQLLAVKDLRGAVRIEHLLPGEYQFRIRPIRAQVKGAWSALYPLRID
ncbi:MAG: glycoside hydrolase family 2 protein [Phycisphaeraceae bacterium JB051]